MTLLLACLVSLQQIQVDTRIDHDRVVLGGTVVLTITVEAAGNAPVQILNPSITGLELLGTSEQSNVSINEGVATRILTRTLRLRATSALLEAKKQPSISPRVRVPMMLEEPP